MKITAADLRRLAPHASAMIVNGIVEHQHLLPQYGIDTGRRLQHFMAQCAQETDGLRQLEENLNYSAGRLREVWPSRFKSIDVAREYAGNPEKLANNVYSSRMGNGPPASGDGWRFRGSGLKMTTGRNNYRQVEAETGLPVVSNPDMLRRFPEALLSACIYWQKNRLSRFADIDDAEGLTRAVNGGLTGFADRQTYLRRAKGIWADSFRFEVSGAQPPAPVLIEPIIRQGSTGQPVRDWQAILRTNGLPVTVDGDFGAKTATATRTLQTRLGLVADGIVGPATRAAVAKGA